MNRRRDGFRSCSRSRSRSCSFNRRHCPSDSREYSPRRWRGRVARRGRSRSYSRPRGGKGFRGKGPPREFGKAGKKGGKHRFPHESDWDCPGCKHLNYGFREECQRCERPRPGPDDRRSPIKEHPPPPPRDGPAIYKHGQPPPPANVPPLPPQHGEHGYYTQGHYGAWNNGGAPVYDPAMYAHYQRRDYAVLKPDAYRAFLAHIRHGVDGIEVFLGNNMCQDHHVNDLLDCLESFLWRSIPQPWRVGRLDLARNGLSDDSVSLIVERLKVWSLRIKRLDLDSNKIGIKGLTRLVEYVWNCPEVILELGLAANAIEASPSENGDDQVSALLRCLYNHPAYPVKTRTDSGIKLVPFILRLHDNKISHGKDLLARISDKGGAGHVHFCDSADPYVAVGEVYLSAFLPFIERQGMLALTSGPPEIPAIEDSAPPESAAAVPLESLPRPPATEAHKDAEGSEEEYSESSESESVSDTGQPQTIPVSSKPAVAQVPEIQRAADPDNSIESGEEEDAEARSASESMEPQEAEEIQQNVQHPPEMRAESTRNANDDDADAEGGMMQMPEDMSKALDILEAAAAAQEKRIARPAAAEPVGSEGQAADAQERHGRIASPGEDSEESPRKSSQAVPAATGEVPQKIERRETSGGLTESKVLRTAGSKKRAKPHRADLSTVPPARSVPRDTPPLNTVNLQLGQCAEGKVTLVRERFALVDCGFAVEGLLHVDDLAREVDSVGQALSLHDDVYVEVSGICQRRNRVSLRQMDKPDAEMQPRPRHKRRVRKSQKRARQKGAADPDPEPERDRDLGTSEPVAKAVGTSAKARPRRRNHSGAVETGGDNSNAGFGDIIDSSLSKDEQHRLEQDIVSEIGSSVDLSLEAEDTAELAEFIVEMLRNKKRPSEVEAELEKFLAEGAPKFVAWLIDHIKGPWVRAARSRAGATPKAAARRTGEV